MKQEKKRPINLTKNLIIQMNFKIQWFKVFPWV